MYTNFISMGARSALLPLHRIEKDRRKIQKMKRLLSMTLAFLMLLSLLAGCGGAPQPSGDAPADSPADAPADAGDAPEAQSI